MTRSREMAVKLLLMAISFTVLVVAAAGAFELYMQVRYNRWRAEFDNFGWLNRVTIKSPNPVLMWEYKPHGELAWNGNQIRINQYGFRDSDPPMTRARAPRTVRVAVIGDSVTLGLGVGEHETLPAQLRAQLDTASGGARNVEVFNFGVDGYNTTQVAELLRTKVIDFQPDVVVYALCANDFDFEESSGEKIQYFKRPRSFSFRLLKSVARRLLQIEYYHGHFYANRDTVYAEIVSMRDTAARGGTRFLVARLPMFPEGAFDPYPIADIDEDIRRFLEANGIPQIDLLEPLRSSQQPPSTLALDPWHPSPEGHRLMAAALARPVLHALKTSSD